MSNLLAARSLMAMSLGFHIIFAIIGMAMPLMMVIAEWRWLKTGDEVYLTIAKRWAKGTAIFFAVGAVTGTVLSFQLGLLWPKFMEFAGPIIGLAFSIEGFAFFTEAIFLGIYLYGWRKVSPHAHLAAGGVVALSGITSGVVVVLANGWMNTPRGFTMINGLPANIDPIAALLNPSGGLQALHMITAAFAATGFAVAGIHAFLLLRHPGNAFHQGALKIALAVGCVSALFQPLNGDFLAKQVAEYQPLKLAAFEGQVHTQKGAPFRLGGIWNSEKEAFDYIVEIPYALSLMLHMDPHGEVIGIKEFAKEIWPPIGVVRTAFQIMVGIGFFMMGMAVWAAWLAFKTRTLFQSKLFLKALVLSIPLGFIATEVGWVATEVGRQPWVVVGYLKTAQAVTPMPGISVSLIFFAGLYAFLAAIVIWLMWRHVTATPTQFEMQMKGSAHDRI
ncbi:cytochrome ubiquinol oxidase subunit I [Candidatus Nitronereus thalassa]|uniref:Cytochrome ubiquinol oxidase subunit I n=1 Tax=Candidatus Nitronereus thalassa TaxID=3020898 RepID=A0ABU3K850_9BACT|nr:cytochrome ubiquinol oxidase subunit I [Candidatus Nitronereus thalassa]MDT7042546.1 cytochrome ubiquinol oxidase subunit I [Candidatus Nitronereus thalassa]